jgi:hypothetical protein
MFIAGLLIRSIPFIYFVLYDVVNIQFSGDLNGIVGAGVIR